MDNWEGRDAAATRGDDPWYDALASGWGEPGPDAAATAAGAGGEAARGVTGTGRAAEIATGAVSATGATGTAVAVGTDAADVAVPGGPDDVVPRPARTAHGERRRPDAAEIYLEVRRSPAFQEVRRRYRRFVAPATLAFLTWYLGYVVAATAVPGLMARPVVGALNVAMVAGLGQFLTTFGLTWAYARHARVHRDRAALELRWDTQQMIREAGVDR
ncbi:hypothetical protein SUDANB25_04523 [Streptomyces sp. SudanB25_2051]